jgi:hypothetical protein
MDTFFGSRHLLVLGARVFCSVLRQRFANKVGHTSIVLVWRLCRNRLLYLHRHQSLEAGLEGALCTSDRCTRRFTRYRVCNGRLKLTSGVVVLAPVHRCGQRNSGMSPNKPLVPTHNGEAPLLAAQRRR